MLVVKIDRLNVSTGWINLEFVGRERTPCEIIKKGIRHHLAEISLLNTIILLCNLGVDQSRTAVHNWVHKADLQPAGGASLDRVAVDQKAIRINDEQYWLYAASDPQTNRIFYLRLFRRVRSLSYESFSLNWPRNTTSKTPCFSLTTLTI